tara:strand:+ start:911 stop:1537 length:627 start_codon:yes stop_codon:yes gene_type:complete
MVAADDLLGLATDDDIVLNDTTGGPVNQYVEAVNHDAVFIDAAAQIVRPISQFTNSYTLISSSLVLSLGALVNTNYLITGIQAGSNSGGYPTVSVTFVSFSNVNKFVANETGTTTILGGFGLVNKFGGTFAQGVSSSMTLSTKTADALEPTSGDFSEGGYTVYGFKKSISLESFDAITFAALKVESSGTRKNAEGWDVLFKTGFVYGA